MTVRIDRSARLPASGYVAEPQTKTGIALHDGVCIEALAATDPEADETTWDDAGPMRVATAYVVDRDGTVYELFDPAGWTWQFGLSWPDPERVRFERRFIGIELVSEGGLTEHRGRLYAYGFTHPLFQKQKSEALECPARYRGYQWYDRHGPEQLDALGRLVDELCERFCIPRRCPAMPFVYYGEALRSFEGVIGHANVRLDVSDPAPDPALWRTLRRIARLEPACVRAPRSLPDEELRSREIDALFERNGRPVDPFRDADLLDRIAKALGFRRGTDE